MTKELLSRKAALTPAQVENYQTAGYLILRGAFTPAEIAEASAEADHLLKRTDLIHIDNIRCRWQPHVETEACLFEAFDPVIDISPVCARLAADHRILDLLACIQGEAGFLFKDKLIFKPPGARGYDLHQDYISWPSFPRSFTSVLIPIDPSSRDNGCIEVFPGWHRSGYLAPQDGNYHPIPEEKLAGATSVPLELEPGDLAIFGSLTPHRSGPNRSRGWRRQIYLSYNASSDGGDQRTEHYREYHEWLKERCAEFGQLNVYFR